MHAHTQNYTGRAQKAYSAHSVFIHIVVLGIQLENTKILVGFCGF